MEIKDDGLVLREERIEVAIRQSVRMFRVRFQLEEIDYVDEANLQIRKPLAQNSDSGQRFHGGNISGAGHHHIRLRS